MIRDLIQFSDPELIVLSRESHDAECALITRYIRLVRACARPMFLAGGDHEDLVQEGMIGLLDAIRSYDLRSETPFASFAALCVRRRMISAVRSASAKKHAPLNDSVPLEQPSGVGADPEAELISREGFRQFTAALQSRLTPAERAVLSLYLDGYSYDEISRRIGKPAKSVDNAVQRIRRKAAAILGEDGTAV